MLSEWLKESFGGYRDNPVTLRDFRVQFRNGRTAALLIIYTLILTLIAYASYSGATENFGTEISEIQSTLTGIYGSILVCLYVLVCTISAYSAAFSVTSERQRKALDLVFSAPFSPRRYVLGKVLGGLRYAGILIALALPAMTTMAAVGGATVEDVLLHALLLAGNAFAWCAVGVAFAGHSKNFILPFAAATGTAFFWNIFAWGTSSAAQYSAMGSMSAGAGRGQTVDWYYSLASTGLGLGFNTPSQTVNLFGLAVPAWIPALLILSLIARFAMVAAAAALEFPPGRSSVWLRLHGIGYVALLSTLLAVSVPATASSFAESRSWTILAACAFLPFLFILFYTAPFGPDKEAKTPDRTSFEWKAVLRGSSTSALPYMWIVTAAWWLPWFALKTYVREPHGFMLAFHSLVFASFWLLVMRYASYLFKTAVMGRAATFMLVAGAFILTAVASVGANIYSNFSSLTFSVMDITPVRPWLGIDEPSTYMALIHIAVLTLITALGYWHLELKIGKKAS